MSGQPKTAFVHLLPVLASMLFGVLCTSVVIVSSAEIYQVTPFPEDAFGFFGPFGNAFYFVILVAVGATLIYLLIKRKSRRLIAVITGFALTAAFLALSIFYVSAAVSELDVPFSDVLVLTVAVVLTVFGDYVVFRGGGKLSSVVLLGLGGALGSFLGISVPATSAIVILVFLAIYDVFAVYRGPVGKIAQSGLEQLKGLSFSFRDIQMGLGDLTFYSMLSTFMLIEYGSFSCVASVIGILVGCVLSFRMLEKKGMFPGLPFSIFLGLLLGFLVSTIS